MGKNPPAMQETPVQLLGPKDPLEKGIGYPFQYSLSSPVVQLVKKSPLQSMGSIQSMGLQRVGHDGVTFTFSIN